MCVLKQDLSCFPAPQSFWKFILPQQLLDYQLPGHGTLVAIMTCSHAVCFQCCSLTREWANTGVIYFLQSQVRGEAGHGHTCLSRSWTYCMRRCCSFCRCENVWDPCMDARAAMKGTGSLLPPCHIQLSDQRNITGYCSLEPDTHLSDWANEQHHGPGQGSQDLLMGIRATYLQKQLLLGSALLTHELSIQGMTAPAKTDTVLGTPRHALTLNLGNSVILYHSAPHRFACLCWPFMTRCFMRAGPMDET